MAQTGSSGIFKVGDILLRAAGRVLFGRDTWKSVYQGTVTAAQLIAMNGTPLTLIAAPGAGYAVIVMAAHFEFVFGTVQFTGGGVVQLQYHGQSANLLASTIAAATIQAAANAQLLFDAANTAGGVVVQANTGIDITNATAGFAAGDGTLKYWIETLTVKL